MDMDMPPTAVPADTPAPASEPRTAPIWSGLGGSPHLRNLRVFTNVWPRPSVQMAETLSFTGTLSTNCRDPKLYWDPKYKWPRPSVQILVPSSERTRLRFLFLHQRGRRKSDACSIPSQCTLSGRRAFLAGPGRPERALQRAHRHGHPMGLGHHREPGAFNALCAPLRADFIRHWRRAGQQNGQR